MTNNLARGVDVDESTAKACRACDETKPLSEFHRKRDAPDGLMGICKPCARTKTRRYAATHKEAIAASDKRYRERNAERIRERQFAYESANREVLRARARAKYAAADEATRERQRELVRAWIRANPERMAEHYRAKRAKRKAAPVGLVDLAALWDGLCGICRQDLDAQIPWPDSLSKSVDHIVPLARGGAHEQSNLQWAHLGCNTAKGARLSDKFLGSP